MNDDDRKSVVMYFKDLKPWPKSLKIDWWSFNYNAKMLEHVFCEFICTSKIC